MAAIGTESEMNERRAAATRPRDRVSAATRRAFLASRGSEAPRESDSPSPPSLIRSRTDLPLHTSLDSLPRPSTSLALHSLPPASTMTRARRARISGQWPGAVAVTNNGTIVHTQKPGGSSSKKAAQREASEPRTPMRNRSAGSGNRSHGGGRGKGEYMHMYSPQIAPDIQRQKTTMRTYPHSTSNAK